MNGRFLACGLIIAIALWPLGSTPLACAQTSSHGAAVPTAPPKIAPVAPAPVRKPKLRPAAQPPPRTTGTIVLRGHEAVVNSAAFSPDGRRIVSTSYDKTVRVWDAARRSQIAVLRGHDEAVSSAAFSPDGRRIVSASEDKTVRVWDASGS